ncbi:hypothetical protein IQ241_04830 [Romeria aff. gracilis LEGE 07310]|uniref:Uncharacterized protein n=1 Tax=Vasconcelosia minhoensis LEGE 07310 TaxID=915328 RepID=A0A8J7DKN5_9CYAN|nr:hypothetical protein [Romeria gracilis]MBE9076626.1 hypothetical protein [Romeria aff. gracilis LEGE 07310]
MGRNARWLVGLGSVLLVLGLAILIFKRSSRLRMVSLPAEEPAAVQADAPVRVQEAATVQAAIAQSEQAAELAPVATTATEWDGVVDRWTAAIAELHSIPPESPARVYAQRRLQTAIQNLAEAQQAAARQSTWAALPTLGSVIIDQQLSGYLSYLAVVGTPDILIVGSSRSLQGIDPAVLQQVLAEQGYPDLKVYNLSINGATVQVVNYLLQAVLTPEQLPKLIIWGGGARSFNSARLDQTFANLLDSPGYRAISAGVRPALAEPNRLLDPNLILSDLTAAGFLPIANQFEPADYYRRFPRVSGFYDTDYRPFSIQGVQTITLEHLVAFLQARGIELIFVNLPLSQDYLDSARLVYERQFQQFLQNQSQTDDWAVIDLLQQWPEQQTYFADPNHLNQTGAASVARLLGSAPEVLDAIERVRGVGE